MDRRTQHRADVQRIAQVLVGLDYPAARWRVLAQADHYGADATSRTQLFALPTGIYHCLPDVLAALGLLDGAGAGGARPSR